MNFINSASLCGDDRFHSMRDIQVIQKKKLKKISEDRSILALMKQWSMVL